MSGTFQYYEDRAGHFRWRLLAANGHRLASGAPYHSRSNVLKGIESVQRATDGAKIVIEETGEPA